MTRWAHSNLWMLVFGLCVVLAGPVAQAGVAVSPLKQDVSVRPGETGKLRVTITNNRRNETDAAQAMRVAVMDVQVAEGGALEFREVGGAKDSAGKWITISHSDVALEPGKSQEIECTVAVPAAAAPGEYYAAVMVALANKGKNEKGLAVEYRIASGLFVTVAGQNFPKQARVARCELVWPTPTTQPADAKPAADATAGPKIVVLMENTGRARFDASGKIAIVDEKARTVFTAALTSGRPCIFAGDSRRFETPLTKALPAGKYRVKVEMDYQSNWAKARYELPIELLPVESEALARLLGGVGAGGRGAPVEVGPEKLSPTIPAGATRSLSVAVSNKADGGVACSARVAGAAAGSASDGWIVLSSDGFTLAKGQKKTVGVVIRVPAGTRAGKYVSTIAVGAGVEGSTAGEVTIPVELLVPSPKAEN